MARLGSIVKGSSRCQTTEVAASFPLSVIKTRPVLVAVHIVPVFCGARAIYRFVASAGCVSCLHAKRTVAPRAHRTHIAQPQRLARGRRRAQSYVRPSA